ncbi:MAG TPA: hypothetical protein VNK49_09580 [Anaerolineales bacterium]|nr:hypothetical protein [Anaerolineales bacterium]
MDALISMLAIFAGILVRLALPIAITAALVLLLRKLDARWQAEAQLPLSVQKPECWKIKGCPPEQKAICKAASSNLPCWQVYRLPNGYLREECLTCTVFLDAPIPTLKIEPRRM